MSTTMESKETGGGSLPQHHPGLENVPGSQDTTPASHSDTDTPKDVEKTLDEEAPVTEPPPTNPMDPRNFPEGGTQAWLAVFGGFLALFCSFGWINCIGIFQDYYTTHQLSAYSPSTIAWIPSLEAFMMFAGGPVIGRIYDLYGPRYLLITGTFFHVFGLMMTSLSTEYYQFILSQGICSPMGASMLFYPAINCLVTWFHRKRALAMGITVSGSSLGGVILPIMVERLIPQIGYGWTMRTIAFFFLGCLTISIFTISSRIPPMKKPFGIKEFIAPFKDKTFVLLAIGAFFTFWGLFLPFNYIILVAEARGMSTHLGQYLVPILNAASIFGRILPGFIADRLGRFNVMLIVSAFSFIVVLALWIPGSSDAASIIFALLFGFGSGALVSLPPALIAQISDVRQIGTRTGTLFLVISFATLTGSPIGGQLVTAQGGEYTHMQIFGGCVMAGGMCFIAAARYSLGGAKIAKRV